jgi:hypothetical protein
LKTRPGLLRSAAVARFRIWLTIALALSAMIGTYLCAQGNDEEDRKRQQFLKTREAEASPTESPKGKKPKSKTTSSSASKKPKPSETTEANATPKAKSVKEKESETEEAKPKPKKSSSSTAKSKSTRKKSTAKKEATPKKKGTAKTSGAKAKEAAASEKIPKAAKAVSPDSMAPPLERPTAPPPRAVVVPPSGPTVAPIEEEPAQVNIEKSGYEKPVGFFARLFGGGGRSSGGGNYRYLTNSIRAQIDRAPVMPRRWQYIIVHNSGTRQGNAAAFDYYHRHVRRMQNGLAYHFVIGNGTSTGNGEVEIGDRWRRQINGGHVHSDYLNNIALGICLVGDFNRDQPTRAQLDCAEELIRYLRQRCGKIDNHYAIVRPHREVNPPRWATDCPGDAFPYSWFRRF